MKLKGAKLEFVARMCTIKKRTLRGGPRLGASKIVIKTSLPTGLAFWVLANRFENSFTKFIYEHDAGTKRKSQTYTHEIYSYLSLSIVMWQIWISAP